MTGIQNKLLTGTIVVMHSEKEAFVVKNTGNTKENLEKRSEVAPLDGNPYGLKLLTRLRLGLSHMRYHKFRYNFQDCINPICACGLDRETTTHFLLHCPLFQSARQYLLINIKKIDESILKKHDKLITKTLLYDNDKFDMSRNKSLILSTIEFIVSTERFGNSLV